MYQMRWQPRLYPATSREYSCRLKRRLASGIDRGSRIVNLQRPCGRGRAEELGSNLLRTSPQKAFERLETSVWGGHRASPWKGEG